jgi:hypothetical protein
MNFLAKSESPLKRAGIYLFAVIFSPIHWAFALSGEIYFGASPATHGFANRIIHSRVGQVEHRDFLDAADRRTLAWPIDDFP